MAGPPGGRASTTRFAPRAPSRSRSCWRAAASWSWARARRRILCASARRHDWEGVLDVLAAVEPVVGARIDGARTPHAARTRAGARRRDRAPGRAVETRSLAPAGAAAPSPLSSSASETFAGRPARQQPAAPARGGQGVPRRGRPADGERSRRSPGAAAGAARWLAPAARAAAPRRRPPRGAVVVRLGVARGRSEAGALRRAVGAAVRAPRPPCAARASRCRRRGDARSSRSRRSPPRGSGEVRRRRRRPARHLRGRAPVRPEGAPRAACPRRSSPAAFCLASRPPPARGRSLAAAVIAVGLGWPATILPGRDTLAMGALALLAALWPLVLARPHATGADRSRRRGQPAGRRRRRRCSPRARARALGGRARLAELGPVRRRGRGHDRRAHLGLRLRRHRVPARDDDGAQIMAPRRALYWRARRSISSPRTTGSRRSTRSTPGREPTLPADPLLPAAPRARADWVKQEVDGRALVDDHVIAAGQPDARSTGRRRWCSRILSGGVMLAPGGPRGARYTVWSYAPRPSPRRSSRSPPRYPPRLAATSSSGGRVVPALRRPRARAPRSTPSSATSATSRSGPTGRSGGRPPAHREGALAVRGDGRGRALAALATAASATTSARRSAGRGAAARRLRRATRSSGYCQQFAGTMALMLRMLGIPARVAVGFTSGTWKDGDGR